MNGIETEVKGVESLNGTTIYVTDENKEEVKTPEKEVAIVPVNTPEETHNVISNVTEENRFKAGKELFGKESGEDNVASIIENSTPKKSAEIKEFTTKSGEKINALDYNHVEFSDIQLVDQTTILDKSKPYWCPDINEKYFTGHRLDRFVFDYVRLSDDKIVLSLNGYTENEKRSQLTSEVLVPHDYAIVSLDQLVAISDYYTKKVKQQQIEDKKNGWTSKLDWVRKKTDEELSQYRPFSYTRLSEKQKKKYTSEQWEALDRESKILEIPNMSSPVVSPSASKRVKQLSEDTMLRSNFSMYKKFINKDYTIPGMRFTSTDEAAVEYQKIRESIKWKRIDMEVQREENMASYEKGIETSYGNSNVKKDLLDSHGVMIKSQNGKELKADQIEQIKTSLTDVYSSFGNRSEMSKKFGLKISHSGEKLMFARKALGIYIPSMRAIGVSNSQVHDKFGFTLAHEYAHFIDNYLGKKNEGRYYASDDFNSVAGKIASTFRSNLNFKTDSNYLNRTCECFARAFEQYHAMKNEGEDVVKSKLNGVLYHQHPDHVNKEKFNTLIKPLIESFLSENDHLLKSAFETLLVF